MPHVGTDMTTAAKSARLFCEGHPTLSIRRDSIAPTNDSFVLASAGCCLKLRRRSLNPDIGCWAET